MVIKRNNNLKRKRTVGPSRGFDLKVVMEYLASGLTILGLMFGIGYWVASIEHKVEIMNLNQRHNNEMSNLRIQMNNHIQSLQNKYDILESEYNLLKDRKEDHDEK